MRTLTVVAVAPIAVFLLAPSATADDTTPQPALVRHGWRVDLTGYLQVDAVPYSAGSADELDPATREPLNAERVLIRRGRLRAEARRDNFFGNLELDGNTGGGAPTARLLGAQLGYTVPGRRGSPPLVAISAGLFKTPFGHDVPASERDKPFLESPAFARALVPGNYDAGALVQGAYGAARYAVAIVNGAPVGDARWRGRDPSTSYDVVGRLGAVVNGPARLRIEAGVSALTGRGLHAGAPPTEAELRWVDANDDGIVQTTELEAVPATPGSPSQTFARHAIGADLQLHWCICVIGTGTAYFEAARATNLDRGLSYADPIAAARDLRHLGFALGVVQSLGAHAYIGARYDRYDADRGAPDAARIYSTLSIMASVRYRDARFVVQYDRERTPLGRGDDGMPTTREADRLTLRAQVGF